jgi:hypothetical protein
MLNTLILRTASGFVIIIYSKEKWMIMISKVVKICMYLVLGSLFLAGPVCALISTVPTGGTVFIGEQGLDVSGPVGVGATKIGWWSSGASIAGSSPDATISVQNPANFYVSPNEFMGHTGPWYVLPAKTFAFTVADPQLDIQVEDTTVAVDVTDKWVPTDDEIQFRINTNLIPISQRGGGNPITFKVQSPDGGSYSSLADNAGTLTPIVNYQITSTPQSTGPIWGTKNRATYPQGTYTIWAESYVNSQSSNVPLCTSRKVTVLIQDQNPLIVNKGYVTNPTTSISLIPTAKITSVVTLTPTTLKTSPPATATPTVLPETTAVTEIPTAFLPTLTPTPTPTKSPGFEASIVVVAMIFGLVFFLKKQ